MTRDIVKAYLYHFLEQSADAISHNKGCCERKVTHLISFLEDSNQQMPNVGTMDTVMPFQADTPAI